MRGAKSAPEEDDHMHSHPIHVYNTVYNTLTVYTSPLYTSSSGIHVYTNHSAIIHVYTAHIW